MGMTRMEHRVRLECWNQQMFDRSVARILENKSVFGACRPTLSDHYAMSDIACLRIETDTPTNIVGPWSHKIQQHHMDLWSDNVGPFGTAGVEKPLVFKTGLKTYGGPSFAVLHANFKVLNSIIGRE